MTEETFEQIKLAMRDLSSKDGKYVILYTIYTLDTDNSPMQPILSARRYLLRQLPNHLKIKMINAETIICIIYNLMQGERTTADDIIHRMIDSMKGVDKCLNS